MHKHLARQLRRLGIDEAAPPAIAAWQELLSWISATYTNMDRERYLVEHSIEIASREMIELNAKIAEERDKFAGIFKAAPSGMAILDTSGIIAEVNQALSDMLQYCREEMIGRPLTDFLAAEERESTQSQIVALARAEITVGRHHRRMVDKTGAPIVADIQSRTIMDAERHPKMILSLVEDVTEKIRLEVDLRHAQKLESVGRLAAGIAHEINTPIQFVGDNVSFLSGAFGQLLKLCDSYRALCQKSAGGTLSAEDVAIQKQQEEAADLDYIRQNVPNSIASTIDGVERVARIVQSMKAFAHPDRGERSVANINNALRNTLTVATNELKYVATVEVDYGDIPEVPCFLSDLNQVFLNLLVNAAHAISDVVGTSGKLGIIRVRTFMEKNNVVVSISDTGTGIPAEVRGRIFDPFFTTKGVGKGTGQGLALAHSVVVEQHGGTITFDTEMGRGTTFFVRIPASPPQEVSPGADEIG